MKIKEDEIILTVNGEIAERCWYEIPYHFSNVQLDAFIFIPNHIQGIFLILNAGAAHVSPLQKISSNNRLKPKSVGAVIGSYKSDVFSWQQGVATTLLIMKNFLFRSP